MIETTLIIIAVELGLLTLAVIALAIVIAWTSWSLCPLWPALAAYLKSSGADMREAYRRLRIERAAARVERAEALGERIHEEVRAMPTADLMEWSRPGGVL